MLSYFKYLLTCKTKEEIETNHLEKIYKEQLKRIKHEEGETK